MTADKHNIMGVGTRKPWEKFDINYERFEAVDEDEADDGLAPGDPSELVPARSFIKKSAARQYESATLPAKQLGISLPEAPFTEKQQRQSRYDGGLEEDGII